MAKTFSPAEVKAAAEALGLVYHTTEDGGMVSGILPYDREFNIHETSKVFWKGDLTVDGVGRIVGANNEGYHSLEGPLVSQLVSVPAYAGKTSFGLTFWINVNEDLSSVARAAGMRIVSESGFTPTIVTFIPDFARRGEVDWVDGKSILSVAEALEADPAEEPVILRKSDLEALVNFAEGALHFAQSDEEDWAAINAAKNALNNK